jgi:hypothetical protein
MRVRIELFMALAIAGWFSAPSHAQNPAVELSAQADRAVARFKVIWSQNKAGLDVLRAREVDEKNSLRSMIEKAGLPKLQPCPIEIRQQTSGH